MEGYPGNDPHSSGGDLGEFRHLQHLLEGGEGGAQTSSASLQEQRLAPKLFLKAMPGGTFQSSPSSSSSSSSSVSPPIKRSIPQLIPKGMAAPPGVPASVPSGLTITRVPSSAVGMGEQEGQGGQQEGSPAYLPSARFLSGTRNFLKPTRKTLPGLTPISALNQGVKQVPNSSPSPTGTTLQARAGSTSTSITITKTALPPSGVVVSSGVGTGVDTFSHGLSVAPVDQVRTPRPVATIKPPTRVSARASVGMQRNSRGSSQQGIVISRQDQTVRPIRIPAGRLPSRAALQMQIHRDFASAALSVQKRKLLAGGQESDEEAEPKSNEAAGANLNQAVTITPIATPKKPRDDGDNGHLGPPLVPPLKPKPNKQPEPEEEEEDGGGEEDVDDNEDDKPTEESKPEEDEGGGSSRRTGRKRKPTKKFTTDFLPQTRRRKGNSESEVASQISLAAAEAESPTTPSPSVRGGRGRGRGSGRGRGRPRGSTLRSRGERMEALAHAEDIINCVSSVKHEVADEVKQEEEDDDKEKESEAEDEEEEVEKEKEKDEEDEQEEKTQGEGESDSSPTATVTPTRGRGRGRGRGISRGTPGTPRGSRRGGRGSRGRGGRNRFVLMAKRRAEIRRAAAAAATPEKSGLDADESETKMSADVKVTNGDTSVTATATPTVAMGDEEASNLSSTSNSTAKTKKFIRDPIEDRKPVTAETLFEYKWPLDDHNAEYYFVQEQLIEFLGHKSFRRKYPDLQRRPVEMEERDFLREQKIVSETQCDLGLTAVNSSEVLDIMYQDFPVKYEDYRKIQVERKEKELTQNQALANGSANNSGTRDRSAEFIQRITKACAKWNGQFNRDRKENRANSYDLQTQTIHLPKGSKKVLPPEKTKVGYFPVSVLAGQFTDNYKSYTPVELRYLPLNTVMYGPIKDNRVSQDSEDSDSDSDASSSSDDSSSSSSDEDGSEAEGNQKAENGVISIDPKDSLGVCKTCNGDYKKNKDGKPEMLIHCAKCDAANHPTCLDLTLDMVPFIKKYAWQCTDCKNCIECNDPADEDKMLFCDCCDRGYHIYCVGLRKVPTGRWHCISCSLCHSCGATEPAPDDRNAEWHHEFKRGEKGTKFFLHSLCASCYKIYKKGQYCPVCLKCHLKVDEKNTMECRNCEKWVHKQCIKKYPQSKFGFMCESCETSGVSFRAKLPVRRN